MDDAAERPYPRVIIVEDNPDVSMVLAALLTLKGAETYKAHSAQECLDRLDELGGQVDAIGMNGSIAMQQGGLLISRIKGVNPGIKILAVASDDTNKAALLRLGADDFGKKPLSAESVVDKILLMLIGEQKVMDAA
jgi:DNA-binding response OmpR family regulator